MNYRKSVSSSKFVSVVNGKKHEEKDIYVRENIGDDTTFLKHMEVGDHSKSMVGKTYKDRMAVVTRVSDGSKVKYSSNVVKSPSNLRRVLRKSLRINAKKKATKGKKPHVKGKGKGKKKGTKGKKPYVKGKGKGKKQGTKGKGRKQRTKGKKTKRSVRK